MAWWWLAVVPLVILAYYGAYLLAFRGDVARPPGDRRSPRWWRCSSPRWPSSTPPTSRARSGPRPSSRPTARAGGPDPQPRATRPCGRATSTCSSGRWRWPALAVALYGLLRRGASPGMATGSCERARSCSASPPRSTSSWGCGSSSPSRRHVLIRLIGGDTTRWRSSPWASCWRSPAGASPCCRSGRRTPRRATMAQVGILLPTLVVMVLLRDQVRQLTLRAVGFERPGVGRAPVGAPGGLRGPLAGGHRHDHVDGAGARPWRLAAGGPPPPSWRWPWPPARWPPVPRSPADPRVESALVEARVAATELAALLKGLLMEELGRRGLRRGHRGLRAGRPGEDRRVP